LGKESAARYESMRGTVESYMSTKHQALDVPSAGDESRREYASGIVEWQGVGTSGAVGGLRLRTWMLRRRADVELLADDERECRIRPRVRLSARAASSFVVPGQLFFAPTFTASARLFHGNAKGVALTIRHDWCTRSPRVPSCRLRIERAKELLSKSPLSINEGALCVGYGSSQTLVRMFRKEVGVSPMQYRCRRSTRSP
jgi:hypothetical protein